MTLGTVVTGLATLLFVTVNMMVAWFEGGLTFNPSISINGLLITAGTVVSAIFAWRDLNWRLKNSEERLDKIERLLEINSRQMQNFNDAILRQDERMKRVEDTLASRRRRDN